MDVKDLLFEALEREPGERSSWLRERADEDTCRRVEELLVAHDAADDRLDAIPEVADLVRRVDAYVPPQVGERIGHFELVRRIGEGGFGVVYHARQEHPVKRDVALKVVKAGMDSTALLARFEAEGRALAVMDHPSIARVFEFGSTERGAPYFAMELVDGEPITQYVARRELGLHARLALFVDVCMAIQHAHQKGVVHRDVKPANVLVTEVDGEPRPKVIDFGIAKALMIEDDGQSAMTRQGHLLGTPAFMSPEQLTGSADIDTRTDVYALGVLLYELLTGETPFDVRGMEITRIIELVKTQDPQRPSRAGRAPAISVIPADLDWVCLRALEKERVRRYESASDLARDIGRYLQRLPVDAAPPSTWYRLRKLAVRHRALAVTGAVVMTALVVAVAGLWVGLDTARRATDEKSLALQNEAAEARRAREVLDFFTHDLLEAVVPSGEAGRGRDVRVIDVLDVAARRLESGIVMEDAFALASLRRSVGASFAALGQLDEARTHLEPALSELTELRGVDHVDVLNVQRTLADVLRGLGEMEAATAILEAHDEALARSGEERAVERLLSETSRGVLLLDQGHFNEALALLERVSEEAELIDSVLYLSALEKRGLATVMAGDPGRAAELFAEVYIGRTQLLGELDPFTLVAQLNTGNALRALDRVTEASTLIDSAVAGLDEVLGPRHPDTIVARVAQLWLMLDRTDVSQTRELAEVALVDAREILGPRHRDTLEMLAVSTAIALRFGDFDQAKDFAEEAYASSRETLGDDHASTRRRANELAAAYYSLERYADVAPLVRVALDGHERELGPTHPSTIQAVMNLGLLHLQLDEFAQADELFEDALSRCDALDGKLPELRLGILSNCVGLRSLQSQHDEAVVIATEALTDLNATGESFPRIRIELRSRRAAALVMLDRVTEAFADMHAAYDLVVTTLGPDSYEAQDLATQATALAEELQDAKELATWNPRLR